MIVLLVLIGDILIRAIAVFSERGLDFLSSPLDARPDRAGIWKSKVFPGLWINGPALIDRKTVPLGETLQHGVASPEHAAFVRKLQSRR